MTILKYFEQEQKKRPPIFWEAVKNNTLLRCPCCPASYLQKDKKEFLKHKEVCYTNKLKYYFGEDNDRHIILL